MHLFAQLQPRPSKASHTVESNTASRVCVCVWVCDGWLLLVVREVGDTRAHSSASSLLSAQRYTLATGQTNSACLCVSGDELSAQTLPDHC